MRRILLAATAMFAVSGCAQLEKLVGLDCIDQVEDAIQACEDGFNAQSDMDTLRSFEEAHRTRAGDLQRMIEAVE